jgi:uncharacterized protein YecT (DUF1311 family)
MRVTWLTLTIVLMPVAAMVGTDIVATCYQTCAESTHSNPEYKACVARAADKADQLLNDSYKELQDAVHADAKEMGQSPDVQLGYLKRRTKAMDRLSQCELHVRGQPRLRRPLDWR